jgi:hypothetical protein
MKQALSSNYIERNNTVVIAGSGATRLRAEALRRASAAMTYPDGCLINIFTLAVQ